MEETGEYTRSTGEESVFSGEYLSVRAYDKHIRYARVTLFIIAGLELIGGICKFLRIVQFSKDISTAEYLIFSAIFAALANFSRKKPITAYSMGLAVYSLLQVVDAVVAPHSWYDYIFLHIAIIMLLVRGITNARQANEWKRTVGMKRT